MLSIQSPPYLLNPGVEFQTGNMIQNWSLASFNRFWVLTLSMCIEEYRALLYYQNRLSLIQIHSDNVIRFSEPMSWQCSGEGYNLTQIKIYRNYNTCTDLEPFEIKIPAIRFAVQGWSYSSTRRAFKT